MVSVHYGPNKCVLHNIMENSNGESLMIVQAMCAHRESVR